MNYLVTGGAGFIGSHIVDKLLDNGGKVRVLDNLSSGRKENLSQTIGRIELIEGDVRDYEAVRSAVEGVDVVFHEAAISSVVKSIEDPLMNDRVNVGGTLNVLQAARSAGVKRVVFASSAAVYGNGGELPKNESMVPNPESPYAASKLAGEYYCKVFSGLFGLDTVCLRYFNVFGERQDPSSEYSGVISKFISAFVSGTSPVIYGDGEQSRDFVYVGDVVDANLLAAAADRKQGLVVNVGCAVRTTVNQVAGYLNSILQKDLKPVNRPARLGDVRDSLADISLIKKELGYGPRINFREGLVKTVSESGGTPVR